MKFKSIVPFIFTLLFGCQNTQSTALQAPESPALSNAPKSQTDSESLPQIAWRSLDDQSLLEAKKSKKYLFVVFETSWCSYCRILKEELKEPAVVKLVNDNFIPIMIQDDDKQLLSAMMMGDDSRVAYPTMMIIDYHEDMIPLMVYQGLLSSDDIVRWLTPAATVNQIMRASEQ